MTYILILFLTYVLHLLLKLNWVCTAVVLVFLLVMQHFHRIKGQRFQEARKRFLDVSLYIDTLLYSFLKEQKIIRAFEDVKSTLADGHMKETVSRAIDHMMLTFDETEVFVDAMRIIEDEYKCNRIVNAHEFMAHAEYYGGDIKESARILLKDKSAWERRILRNIEDRQRMFHQIILSVVTSVIISGIILYLPVLSMDISSNIIVQILSAALICLNQHRIGHRLMKKNLIADVKSAFPKWLMDLALLIQSENVQVAIQKSREHIPVILKEEVNMLVERLDVEPESSDPYHRFLDCLNLPEINAAMGMLYAVSIGNSGNCGSQIDELITKNLEMLDVADTARLKDKTAGMYLLFLAPVITASFKMIVDMAIFLISFLSYKVV